MEEDLVGMSSDFLDGAGASSGEPQQFSVPVPM